MVARLHAAGFFMPRGVKLFGLDFYCLRVRLVACRCHHEFQSNLKAHWLMGFFFGVLHLAYGAYLYLTEKGKNAA